MSKNKEINFQAVTDLVAVHALAQIAWKNSQEEQVDLPIAEHQSDSGASELAGGHHSDSNDYKNRVEANPITFAWKLMKMLRSFFEGR